jgi:hypothetical protein
MDLQVRIKPFIAPRLPALTPGFTLHGLNLAPARPKGDFSPWKPDRPAEAMAKEDIPNRADHYPRSWEHVAQLRVFRTSTGEWDKVVGWRTDMLKRGWKLLRVSTDAEEIVAVFGKTRIGQRP